MGGSGRERLLYVIIEKEKKKKASRACALPFNIVVFYLHYFHKRHKILKIRTLKYGSKHNHLHSPSCTWSMEGCSFVERNFAFTSTRHFAHCQNIKQKNGRKKPKNTLIRWEARARARGREMKHEEAQSVLHSSQLQTSTGEWDTAISSWEEENPASHAEFSVWDAERGASHMDSSKTTLLRAAGSVRDN